MKLTIPFWRHILAFIFVQNIESTCVSNVCKPNIKQWTSIQSQSSSSRKSPEHGCSQVPIKVDIQLRPQNGPDTHFVFPGLGSAQRNDNETEPYGGLVYKYNEENIIMYAPNKNDGKTSGSIIYTGGSTWQGPTQQKTDDAEVRVRAWCPNEFRKADFESSPLDISNNGTRSYIEVPHNLGAEPQLVTLQVELGGTLYYSDGIGSMTALLPSAAWGGVIYGYDKNVVRIWAPSKNNGKIFSALDGWGNPGGQDKVFSAGKVIVRVWTTLVTFTKQIPLGPGSTGTETTLPVPVDVDNDLVFLTVKATDGANKDFSFPASGAVQNAASGKKYGGVVYSYSNNKMRVWVPPLSDAAFLIYISDDWGNGKNGQESKSAIATINVWRANRTGVTTTTSTTKLTTHLKYAGITTAAYSTNNTNSTVASETDESKFPILPVAIGTGSFLFLVLLTTILICICKRKGNKTAVENLQT